jgi:hypothetical protein
MTSGEVAHRALSSRPDSSWQALGTACVHITWGARGAIDISGLDLTCTTDPERADFILAHGVEALGVDGQDPRPHSLAELEALLSDCAKRKLLMIVANPDVVTVSGCMLRAVFWSHVGMQS